MHMLVKTALWIVVPREGKPTLNLYWIYAEPNLNLSVASRNMFLEKFTARFRSIVLWENSWLLHSINRAQNNKFAEFPQKLLREVNLNMISQEYERRKLAREKAIRERCGQPRNLDGVFDLSEPAWMFANRFQLWIIFWRRSVEA